MKTLIKSLALALTLGIATSAASFAETNPGGRPSTEAAYQSAIYTTNSGKLSIALDKPTGNAVDIRFKSTNGDVLYSKHLGKRANQYRTRLNLSDLPDGVYQVEITSGVEKTMHSVTISTQQPEAPSRVIAMK